MSDNQFLESNQLYSFDHIGEAAPQKNCSFQDFSPKQRTSPTHPYDFGLVSQSVIDRFRFGVSISELCDLVSLAGFPYLFIEWNLLQDVFFRYCRLYFWPSGVLVGEQFLGFNFTLCKAWVSLLNVAASEELQCLLLSRRRWLKWRKKPGHTSTYYSAEQLLTASFYLHSRICFAFKSLSRPLPIGSRC